MKKILKLALVLSLCRWYCFSRRTTWSRWTSRPHRVARYPRSQWTQRLVQLVMFGQNESFSSPLSSLILYFPETVTPIADSHRWLLFQKDYLIVFISLEINHLFSTCAINHWLFLACEFYPALKERKTEIVNVCYWALRISFL